jgi:hypothetical protein
MTTTRKSDCDPHFGSVHAFLENSQFPAGDSHTTARLQTANVWLEQRVPLRIRIEQTNTLTYGYRCGRTEEQAICQNSVRSNLSGELSDHAWFRTSLSITHRVSP